MFSPKQLYSFFAIVFLQVLNREFEETCSVDSDLRSVLFMLFNPVKDELITGGVGGLKVREWAVKRAVLNLEFKEICSVESDLRSVLFMLVNPVKDEFITGGVGGLKVRERKRAVDRDRVRG